MTSQCLLLLRSFRHAGTTYGKGSIYYTADIEADVRQRMIESGAATVHASWQAAGRALRALPR